MSTIADIRAGVLSGRNVRQAEARALLAVAGAASALDGFLEGGFVTFQQPLVNDGAGSWVPAATLLALEALGDALHEALVALGVAV